jgi:hypothetical protein
MPKYSQQPSLFDNLDDNKNTAPWVSNQPADPSIAKEIVEMVVALERDKKNSPSWTVPIKEWHETPQAVYLSWSEQRQLAYCAARDRHTSIICTNDERAFFLERAAMYDSMGGAGEPLETKGGI